MTGQCFFAVFFRFLPSFSEARVARLVADGRSNADVAQELFVSLKTIETHLTSVYGKLDLSGPGARRRLAQALAE